MVLMMLIGYISAKLKITGPEFNQYASTLMTGVLLPATILKSSIGVETTVSNGEVFYILLLYFVMMGVAYVIAKLTSKLLPADARESGVILCLVMYMNVVYIGFPMAETVYGSEASFYACLSCMPFNALVFSAGAVTLRGSGKAELSLGFLKNPALIATVVGIVLFLLRVPVPEVISGTVSSIAGATVPISMIILGTSLAGVDLKSAFSDWRIYVVSLIRLIICPIAVYFIVGLLTDNEMVLGTITILSATPAAVLLTAMSIQYGVDEKLASKGIFVSTLMSAVTLPFIVWLLL